MDTSFNLHFDHEELYIPEGVGKWKELLENEAYYPFLQLNTLNDSTPYACRLSLTTFELNQEDSVGINLDLLQLKALRRALDVAILEMELAQEKSDS